MTDQAKRGKELAARHCSQCGAYAERCNADVGRKTICSITKKTMGHAAYARGSAAISAQIDQQAKRNRKPDALMLAEARAERESSRADKAEAKVAELENTLKAARRSVVSLRGSLECEREERRAEVENWKFKAQFAAKMLSRRRLNSANGSRQESPGERA